VSQACSLGHHQSLVRTFVSLLFVLQKKYDDGRQYGNYRDASLAAGQNHGGHTLQPNDFYFADNPILNNLEDMAKREGLQFIEELVFENGAVYKGKAR
jgi:hypothetical protein